MRNGKIIDRYDTVRYYVNGELHREDGPAVEYANGHREWHINGKLHREDGPAIEWTNGRKDWYVNGKRHKEDGPAIEYADGGKEWWIRGRQCTKEQIAEIQFNIKFNKFFKEEFESKLG